MKSFILLFSLLLIGVINLCCNDYNIDLVNQLEPVHKWSPTQIATIEDLKNVPATERQKYLQENWPSLSSDLVLFLKSRNKIGRGSVVDSIVYKYGSGKRIKSEDASGKIYSGFFNDQLVAFIYTSGKSKPLLVIVACTNGLFRLPEDLQYVGTESNFGFTIEKTRGIAYYVGSDETAINLAELFNRPLYRGKGINPKYRISPAEARGINTDQTQVTVLVYTGDYFNLNNMEYRPATKR